MNTTICCEINNHTKKYCLMRKGVAITPFIYDDIEVHEEINAFVLKNQKGYNEVFIVYNEEKNIFSKEYMQLIICDDKTGHDYNWIVGLQAGSKVYEILYPSLELAGYGENIKYVRLHDQAICYSSLIRFKDSSIVFDLEQHVVLPLPLNVVSCHNIYERVSDSTTEPESFILIVTDGERYGAYGWINRAILRKELDVKYSIDEIVCGRHFVVGLKNQEAEISCLKRYLNPVKGVLSLAPLTDSCHNPYLIKQERYGLCIDGRLQWYEAIKEVVELSDYIDATYIEYAIVSRESKLGLVDLRYNQEVLPCKYSSISKDKDNKYLVAYKSGNNEYRGVFDLDKKCFIIWGEYDSINPVFISEYGYDRVYAYLLSSWMNRDENHRSCLRWGLKGVDGSIICPLEYDGLSNLLKAEYKEDGSVKESLFFPFRTKEGYRLYNMKGERILPQDYDSIDIVQDGYGYAFFIVKKDKKYGLYRYRPFGGEDMYFINHVELYIEREEHGRLKEIKEVSYQFIEYAKALKKFLIVDFSFNTTYVAMSDLIKE